MLSRSIVSPCQSALINAIRAPGSSMLNTVGERCIARGAAENCMSSIPSISMSAASSSAFVALEPARRFLPRESLSGMRNLVP